MLPRWMLQMRPVIVSGRILASSQILFWSLINDYKRDAATMIHSKTQYPTETLHSVLSKFLASLYIFLILFGNFEPFLLVLKTKGF